MGYPNPSEFTTSDSKKKKKCEDKCHGNGYCVFGKCQCHDGYTGNTCKYPMCNGISKKSKGVCSGHGKCKAVDCCHCDKNYYGKFCKTHTSKVITCQGISYLQKEQTCSGHGRCVDTNVCQCDYQWVGRYCDRFIGTNEKEYFCDGISSLKYDQVCTGHGECVEENKCECSEKYEGTFCSKKIEEPKYFYCDGVRNDDIESVCSGNGKCVETDTCVCLYDFYGDFCSLFKGDDTLYPEDTNEGQEDSEIIPDETEVQVEDTEADETIGEVEDTEIIPDETEVQVEDTETDETASEFEDTEVIIEDTIEQPEDTEEKPDDTIVETISCDGIPQTSPLVCSSHGTCISNDKCVCEAGYSGLFCHKQKVQCYGIFDDDQAVCSNGNGVCVYFDTCVCYTGFIGAQCEFNEVIEDTINEVITCQGIPSTSPEVCSSHGSCISTDQCVCLQGYEGDFCDIEQKMYCYGYSEDDPFVCSANGNCVSPDTCECFDGFSGENCQDDFEIITCNEISHTSPDVCSSHGTCIAKNWCICEIGYSGEFCSQEKLICFEIFDDDPSVCSNGNGKCISLDTCECFIGFYGPECEFIEGIEDTEEQITCGGILDTSPLVCSSHGRCITENVCVCDEGYTGLFCDQSDSISCFGVDAIDPLVCSGEGVCEFQDTCICTDGFFGIECQHKEIIEDTIERRWECFGVKYDDPDSTKVCSGHGDCIKENECLCTDDHYYGEKCEIYDDSHDMWKCFGVNRDESTLVCSGHGVCIQEDICDCHSPIIESLGYLTPSEVEKRSFEWYYGDMCELFKCFGVSPFDDDEEKACFGHGQCIGPNKCICEEEYDIREDCSEKRVYECQFDCSHHGECVGDDICQCVPQTHYYGEFCQNFDCFNIPSENLETVCSSHGTCTDYNQCLCEYGYWDDACEKEYDYLCFDVPNTSPDVCSNHGECVAPDLCECDKKYCGDECDLVTHKCFSLFWFDPHVCSGHGDCQDSNDCLCWLPYHGEDCSEKFHECNGTLEIYTDIVCSNGRGQCIADERCSCHKNFTGKYCELLASGVVKWWKDSKILGTVILISTLSPFSLFVIVLVGLGSIIGLFYFVLRRRGIIFAPSGRYLKFESICGQTLSDTTSTTSSTTYTSSSNENLQNDRTVSTSSTTTTSKTDEDRISESLDNCKRDNQTCYIYNKQQVRIASWKPFIKVVPVEKQESESDAASRTTAESLSNVSTAEDFQQ